MIVKKMLRWLFPVVVMSLMVTPAQVFGQTVAAPKFRVLALAEGGEQHKTFVDAAKIWLDKLAAENHFAVDYISDTKPINEEYLSHYKLIIQVNYPPFGWTPVAEAAFERYIDEGLGGWIGFHHATLLGDFEGYKMSPWWSNFMGGIRFKSYIANFVDGEVTVEDKTHPVMQGVPAKFKIEHEEWYTYDKSPRPNVHVLASVDEDTYEPNSEIRMGDHPVVWTNEHVKARNVYIFMGHHGDLFQNAAFTTLVKNSIFWAANQ
jgi:uncharacterized protein